MTVRAKFKCIEVTKRQSWSDTKLLYAAKFSPVTQGSEENKRFYDATPSGHIELATYKEDLFQVGAEYYIDFTKAE